MTPPLPWKSLIGLNNVIKSVPLDGNAASFADQSEELFTRHRLFGLRTGHMGYNFFLYRTVNIIGTE